MEWTCSDDGNVVYYKEYLRDGCEGDAVTPEYAGEWDLADGTYSYQPLYEQMYDGLQVGDCLVFRGVSWSVEEIFGVCPDPPAKTSGATLSATIFVPTLVLAARVAVQDL